MSKRVLVVDDESAKLASKLMAINHQNILQILSVIWCETGENYLVRFLHPEYSLVDFRFKNFDPFDLSKLQIISKELKSKNKLKNQERYIRISFESLKEFSRKDNRRAKSYYKEIKEEISNVVAEIKANHYDKADELLQKAIVHLGNIIYDNEWKLD